MEFRVGAAEFKKVPTFTFELIFVRDRTVALKSLMLLTGKQLVPLRCRTRPCQHNFPIPRVQLAFSPKSPFGFEVRKFVESSRQSVCIVYRRLGSCVGSLPPAPRRSTCPTSAATSTQWRSFSPPPGSTTGTSRHPGRPGLARCRLHNTLIMQAEHCTGDCDSGFHQAGGRTSGAD